MKGTEMQQQKRMIGQTRDVGFQIGVRRTLPIAHEATWQLVTSAEGRRIWLDDSVEVELAQGATYRLADGTSGKISVFTLNSHLRMTWQPPGWTRVDYSTAGDCQGRQNSDRVSPGAAAWASGTPGASDVLHIRARQDRAADR